MNLYKQIKINSMSTIELVKKLKYDSLEKRLNTLEVFNNHKNLSSWLHSGYYDFKYTPEQFLKQLCILFNINESVVNNQLGQEAIYYTEIEKFSSCYIFVNTNFKRK